MSPWSPRFSPWLPVMMINEETYGSLTPDKVRKVMKEYRKK